MRRRPGAVAAGLAAWLVASTAAAQSPERDPRFETGRALRAAHQDEAALAVFRELYESTHASSALAQVALAEGALGRWVSAEAHLAEALATPDRWTSRHRALLDSAREEIAMHVGDLQVECPTPGASLWVDGQRAAALPLARPLRVVAGTVTIEVRAEGHVTATRTLSVVAGSLAREPIALVAVAPAPAVVAAPVVVPPPPVVVAPAVVVVPASPRQPVPPAPPGGRRTAAWATAVGAVVLGVGAGALYGVGAAQVADYNDDGECPGERENVVRPARCATLLDTAYGLRAGAIVSLVAAAGSAVASTVLFTTPARPTAPRVACGGGPGTIGVACIVGF